MSTENQIAANRRNGLHSTGPKTERGRRAVARNAIQGGVFSKLVVLPDEDAQQFKRFARALRAELAPVGALEALLADSLVACLWRWHQLHGIEAGLLTMYRVYEGVDRGLATAFAHDASQLDSLGQLTRYETAPVRRFHRLLHELQRLQAARAGAAVPPPAVVDLELSGAPLLTLEDRPEG